jgi:hypothetical protein
VAIVSRGFGVWSRGRFLFRETRAKIASSEAASATTSPERPQQRAIFLPHDDPAAGGDHPLLALAQRVSAAVSRSRKCASPCSAKICGISQPACCTMS